MRNIFFFFLVTCHCIASGQKFTISGYVTERQSGENLTGANVYLKETNIGAVTNSFGFYSISADIGEYTLVASFMGKQDSVINISLTTNRIQNFALDEKENTTKEILVLSERSDKNVQSTEMGNIRLPVDQIKSLPAFLGEVDILKTIQLLPGVQSAGEGNSGFYVRGGGPDQNLILLDDAIIYNASHLFGFFSIFNADIIKDVDLIKGGMPANYGGRLSSVLDITMKDGNNQEFQANGGIGLISSRLSIEGPLVKNKASFIIAARRTYIDILANPFISDSNVYKGTGYYFYDLNAKFNYRFSDYDHLYLSGYFGRDVFTYKNSKSAFNVDVPWGNAMASLRWNHLFNQQLFMNACLLYSDYNFQFDASEQNFELKIFSGIQDVSSKVDFTYLPFNHQTIKFGVDYTFHTFIPSGVSAQIGGTSLDLGQVVKQYAHDGAIYVNDEFDLWSIFKFNFGLRGTMFSMVGPFERFVKDANDENIDTLHYAAGQIVKTYIHVEPRLSMRVSLNSSTSIKASYTQNYQNLHMASYTSVSLPTDLWVPSSDIVKPEMATQYSVGLFKNFHKDDFETSVELYYKEMTNLIEYKDGSVPRDNVGDNPDNNFAFGNGQSYGMELFIKKRTGKLTGWIGYTLAKTTRTFPDINGGLTFPAKYDRRHDLSVIATYELSKRWSVSAVFVYATGNATTLPIGRYLIDGRIINEYGERNSYRLDAYHRMDISATYQKQKKGKYESSWNFSIYNVYDHLNPYFIYFENTGTLQQGTFTTTAKQVSLFPFLPSVSWNFKF